MMFGLGRNPSVRDALSLPLHVICVLSFQCQLMQGPVFKDPLVHQGHLDLKDHRVSKVKLNRN